MTHPPPASRLLSHRGIEAWLTNEKAHIIPHGVVNVVGNQITTTVQSQVPPKTGYRVRWRSTQDKPLTALCEIIVPSPQLFRDDIKAASYVMDAAQADTQYHTSRSALSAEKDGWFHTPPATDKEGFVQLEIRRAKRASPTRPKWDLRNLIDDEDDPPFIVFRFKFEGAATKRCHSPEANAGPQKRQKTVEKPASHCGGRNSVMDKLVSYLLEFESLITMYMFSAPRRPRPINLMLNFRKN
ncbi:hypothetical protein B0H19DRAFT_1162748 [Mycena capillaripes]|nr:hypothetical protein B0H19DRAFT_1162748 [Mycena capillaripes]